MKIYFLAKAPDATCFYRCELPMIGLREAGHQVELDFLESISKISGSGVKRDRIEWADVVVVQRPTSREALVLMQAIKAEFPHKALIGDYDDDYYSVPVWNPGFPHIKARETIWRAAVREFDAIVTSTEPLQEAFRENGRFQGPTKVICNGFDFQTFDALEDAPESRLDAIRVDPNDSTRLLATYSVSNRQFNELMKDKPVVAWAGSRFHYSDLDWVAREMKLICDKIPEVVFLFIGYVQHELVCDIPMSRVFATGGAFPVMNFYRLLRSLKMDIMLAPLHPVKFNFSKSNLKVMESMALGAYPICSALDPYDDDILFEGVHEDFDPDFGYGRLIQHEAGEGAWCQAIADTIADMADPAMWQATIRHNAEYIRRNHDFHNRTQDYVSFFEEMSEAKR